MYLHIGNNVMLKYDEVIGVFSISSLKKDAKGKKFFNELMAEKKVRDISEGKQTSLVLTDNEVYITRISSSTLKARSNADIDVMLGLAKDEVFAAGPESLSAGENNSDSVA